MTAVAVLEKSIGTPETATFQLRLASERVAAHEVIRSHVRAEVEKRNVEIAERNARQSRVASFLIGTHSHDTEARLNTSRPTRKLPELDAEQEIENALSGFKNRRVIMLFDDQEVEDLDQPLIITDDSQVTFLRLLPLMGG